MCERQMGIRNLLAIKGYRKYWAYFRSNDESCSVGRER